MYIPAFLERPDPRRPSWVLREIIVDLEFVAADDSFGLIIRSSSFAPGLPALKSVRGIEEC